MGLFGLFKSKEKKEKEKKEREEKARVEKERIDKIKDFAWNESKKIIDYFENESKKIIKYYEDDDENYNPDFFYLRYSIEEYKDKELKIYITLYVAEHFIFGSFSNYRDVESLFAGHVKSSKYYYKCLFGKEFLDQYKGEDYYKDEIFKDSYYVNGIRFKDCSGISCTIYKNSIECGFRVGNSSESDYNNSDYNSSYDRGGLLYQRTYGK